MHLPYQFGILSMCTFCWFEWFFTKTIQICVIDRNVCVLFFRSDLSINFFDICRSILCVDFFEKSKCYRNATHNDKYTYYSVLQFCKNSFFCQENVLCTNITSKDCQLSWQKLIWICMLCREYSRESYVGSRYSLELLQVMLSTRLFLT